MGGVATCPRFVSSTCSADGFTHSCRPSGIPCLRWKLPRRRNDPLSFWLAAAAGVVIAAGSFLSHRKTGRGQRLSLGNLPTITAGTLALAEGMDISGGHARGTDRSASGLGHEVSAHRRIRGRRCARIGASSRSEKLEVVDLGTRFGATSSPVAGAHVFVFDGEVTVREENEEEAQHVLGGRSVFGERRGQIWTAYSTAIGRGKDVFIRNGDSHGPTGSLPLLMVKHTDLVPSNQRRMLMTFTSELSEAKNAALSLKIESIGFPLPDSEFSVYGAIDPSFTNGARARWKNSPN